MAGVEQAKEAKFIQLQEKKAEERKEIDLKKVEEKAEAKREEKKADEHKGKQPEDKKAAEKTAPPAKKTEEKKEEKKEEPKKREIVLERIYTVPLIAAYSKPLMKRGNAAITLLRRFLERHMKADEKKVKISLILNNIIRKRGSGRPLKKVKIKATKDKEGVVIAEISA
ncbi:MAG: 50S ribosomal protein L31e [Candidatus Micrarchaeota archaeon]